MYILVMVNKADQNSSCTRKNKVFPQNSNRYSVARKRYDCFTPPG